MWQKNSKTERPLPGRRQRIHKFLSDNKAGVLCSTGTDGEPHGSVIYYVLNQDLSVSFITKDETRKYANLKSNSSVMLVVFDERSQTVAQVIGEAAEIKDHYEINKVAAAIVMTSIKTSDGGIPPIAKLNAGEYTAFTVHPDQIRIARYAKADSAENIFESIESYELNPAAG